MPAASLCIQQFVLYSMVGLAYLLIHWWLVAEWPPARPSQGTPPPDPEPFTPDEPDEALGLEVGFGTGGTGLKSERGPHDEAPLPVHGTHVRWPSLWPAVAVKCCDASWGVLVGHTGG